MVRQPAGSLMQTAAGVPDQALQPPWLPCRLRPRTAHPTIPVRVRSPL